MRITKTKNSLQAFITLTIIAGGMIGSIPHILAASSWAPTLIVNTEAFQVIDDTDSGSDLYLQFGGTLNKRLTYDRTLSTFIFDDDLEVIGAISGATIHAQDILTSSGQLIVEANDTFEPASIFLDQNANGTGMLIDSESGSQAALALDIGANGRDASGDATNTHLLFGYNNVFDTNLFRQKADTLYTDDSLWVGETLSGSIIRSFGLSDCDDATNSKLLWDATTGQFSCGTDQAGSGGGSFSGTGSLQNFFDNRYVEKSGDTMTGALVIKTESDSTAGFQVNDADGGNPVLNVDTTNERVGIGTASPTHTLDVNGVGRFGGINIGGYSNITNDKYISTEDTEIGFLTDGGTALPIKVGSIAVTSSFSNTAPTNGAYIQGSVGIGTTSPSEKLEVVGTASGEHLHFGRLLTGSGYAIFRNVSDSTTSFQVNDADGGNPVLNVDTTNERVGIGTASPSYKLHVKGSNGNTAFFEGGGGRSLEWGNSSAIGALTYAGSIPWVTSIGANDLVLGTNNAEKVRILSTGEVGIGDTTPTTKLDVAGGISGTALKITGAGTFQNTTDSTTGFQVNDADGGNPVLNVDTTNERVGIGTASPSYALDVAGGDTVAFFDGSNAGYIGVGRSTSNYLRLGVTSANVAAVHSTSTSPISFSINGTERMRITNAGDIGIGTDAPQEKLHISGGGNVAIDRGSSFGSEYNGTFYKLLQYDTANNVNLYGIGTNDYLRISPAGEYQFIENGDKHMVINVDGNVGIGTGFPTEKLEVVGTISGTTLHFGDMLSGSGYAIFRNVTDSTTSFQINDADGGNPVFNVDTTNERVGIGTASPLAKLDVIGVEYETGAYIYSSGASVLALDNYSGTTGSGMNAHISFGYKNVFDTELYRHGPTGSGGIVIKTQQTSTSDNAFRVITQNGSENNTVFKVRADGAVTAEGSFTGGGADLAEWFPTADLGMKPGDITCLDPARPKHVKRCNSYDLKMIGIVSTKPGFIGNSQIGIEGNSALIGLIGQVPVKVIGNVDIGDSITLSKTDSVGKRAGEYDPSICIAMEEHRGGEIGVVTCLLTRNTGSSGGAPVNSKTVADYLLKSFKDTMRLDDF